MLFYSCAEHVEERSTNDFCHEYTTQESNLQENLLMNAPNVPNIVWP